MPSQTLISATSVWCSRQHCMRVLGCWLSSPAHNFAEFGQWRHDNRTACKRRVAPACSQDLPASLQPVPSAALPRLPGTPSWSPVCLNTIDAASTHGDKVGKGGLSLRLGPRLLRTHLLQQSVTSSNNQMSTAYLESYVRSVLCSCYERTQSSLSIL